MVNTSIKHVSLTRRYKLVMFTEISQSKKRVRKRRYTHTTAYNCGPVHITLLLFLNTFLKTEKNIRNYSLSVYIIPKWIWKRIAQQSFRQIIKCQSNSEYPAPQIPLSVPAKRYLFMHIPMMTIISSSLLHKEFFSLKLSSENIFMAYIHSHPLYAKQKIPPWAYK